MKMNTPFVILSTIAAMHAFAGGAYAESSDFLQRSSEIHAQVEKKAASMDAAYDFSKLAIDGMLPPVLQRTDSAPPVSLASPCGGGSSCSLVIVELARPLCQQVEKAKPCTPLTWRDIIFDSLPDAKVPQGGMTANGAHDSAEADAIFQRNCEFHLNL